MSELAETRQAIFELRSSEQNNFGFHMGTDLAVGVPGIQVGEVPFDPARHPIAAIDPFSAMESMLDRPHVSEVMPYIPVDMNVILHRDPAERSLHSFLQPVRTHKQELAASLSAALMEAKQVSDGMHLYIVGDTDLPAPIEATSEAIVSTEDPQKAAETVAEICATGLSFVISDFNNLPLPPDPHSYEHTIGIKANHQLELEIPFIKRGPEWRLQGLQSVNTGNAKQVAAANEQLAHKHAGIEAHLGALGLVVARVVYSNHQTPLDNLLLSDKHIAQAVRVLARR